MKTALTLGLAFALLGGIAALSLAMPLSPYAVNKAGGFATLSPAVLAPPPDWVDKPLSIPSAGHIGNYQILIIVIEFADQAYTYTAASFDSMAFGPWPTGSMNDYYTEVSYGNLTLSGEVWGWYTASQNRAYYGNGQKGWGAYPQNAAKLVEEAVDAAEAAGCDFSKFDNDGDGVAESIIIVHSGEGSETSLDPDDIQSHESSLTNMGGTARTYDGVTIDTYVCCPELQSSSPVAHINIGVFCHEYGHILGLPDLYDVGRWCTSYSSWGIGVFGLMAFGGWGGDVQTPSRPTHMCAWSKIKLGWLSPTILADVSQSVTLNRVEQYPAVLKLGMTSRASQYFLISFRDSAYGFDNKLPKRGLLIYHIDDDSWSQNDCENGGSCTSGGFHYMVAVEQPDGNFDLDCGTASNYGDRGDMYPYAGIATFDGSTTPNSDTYEGTSSGVSVSGITFSGSTQMSMSITSGTFYPEIRYDDGAYNICYRYGVNDAGFALKITPPKYPALIRGLLIMSCDYYNTTFQCRIWDDAGTGGTPGSPLSPVHTVTGAPPLAWTYEDFTADSIIVSSGDFWAVYIEYNNSQLATDNDSPWSGRTMTYYAGNFSPDNGAYGNYMIRAVVDTVFCAGIPPTEHPGVVVTATPNPFDDQTLISFSLSSTCNISVAIYDVTGKLVKQLIDRRFNAGNHSVVWDGRDAAGNKASSGIYFCRLKAGKTCHNQKITLLRSRS